MSIRSVKNSTITQASKNASALAGNPSYIDVPIRALIIAGGGGGERVIGSNGQCGGGGAGGHIETTFTLKAFQDYEATVGAGGAGRNTTGVATAGVNSSFNSLIAIGGGARGVAGPGTGVLNSGGSGAGHKISLGQIIGNYGGEGTEGQGFEGGGAMANNNGSAAGGGGAGSRPAFAQNQTQTSGGVGRFSDITGTNIQRGGGGAGSQGSVVAASSDGGGGGGASRNGVANTGSGGAGLHTTSGTIPSGNGGSGVIILRYPERFTITLGAGLTGSTATVGADRVTTITAGTGNVSWEA